MHSYAIQVFCVRVLEGTMGIEVIGAGYGRTGTSSFQKAMIMLGFGSCYHMREVFDNGEHAEWAKMSDTRDLQLLRGIMEKGGYRSSCDMPSRLGLGLRLRLAAISRWPSFFSLLHAI
jgi:hypothetical protein